MGQMIHFDLFSAYTNTSSTFISTFFYPSPFGHTTRTFFVQSFFVKSSKWNAHSVHTFMKISVQYSSSIHLYRLSKSNAHLVHTSRQMQYSPSAHLLRRCCQYSPNAHLVLTQYTSDTQLMFCSPFHFCNAHLVLTCNAHLIRCVLCEH